MFNPTILINQIFYSTSKVRNHFDIIEIRSNIQKTSENDANNHSQIFQVIFELFGDDIITFV